MSTPLTPENMTLFMPDIEETLSLLISLGCITVMSLLFGRKTAGTKLATINYARGLVIALYLVSWTFSFIAAQLVQTNDYNFTSCSMSILTCIVLYAASKIIIYLFLMEKVYVVTAIGQTRREFWLYRVNMALMTPYVGVIVLMVKFRAATIDEDGICRIGLLRESALPLILYDLFLSTWLTMLFIRPLLSSKSTISGPSKSRLRDVARKTMIGALVALMLSSCNIFTLAYFQGRERGLMCLSSCTADVTLNAITIHWVTSRANLKTETAVQGGGGKNAIGANTIGGSRRNVSTTPEKSQLGTHVTVEAYVEEFHMRSFSNPEPSEVPAAV
ncbi:hypothetical protein EMPS_02770 [Entomortierella parvispora]|uniref:Uncharacterized protein n=1 Tax=Entomortierella parvispora TaxID=205924 RepID=A0A9P3LTS9_9FUNG|nr:hypothetical protein EMPS_02770 [Entomortierella parvispora]